MPTRSSSRRNPRVHGADGASSPAEGSTGSRVDDAGLRHLEGVYLVEIQRAGGCITPVEPDRLLRDGDRLVFAGRSDLIVDLQRTRGLAPVDIDHVAAIDSPQHTFFEAVIAAGGPLAGQTLEQADFRRRYQAAVLAIHRAGQRVSAQARQRAPARRRHAAGARRPRLPAAVRGGQRLPAGRRGSADPRRRRRARRRWSGLIVAAIVILAALDVLPILQARAARRRRADRHPGAPASARPATRSTST